MSAETLRLPERLLIWGELLYFEVLGELLKYPQNEL